MKSLKAVTELPFDSQALLFAYVAGIRPDMSLRQGEIQTNIENVLKRLELMPSCIDSRPTRLPSRSTGGEIPEPNATCLDSVGPVEGITKRRICE